MDGMIRVILMGAGLLLGIWVIFAMLGWLFSIVKLLLTVALIAVVGYFVVQVILKLSKD
ncbi:hypothetical protein GCM10027589_15960 [Actinocorallia lasiicapitis]